MKNIALISFILLVFNVQCCTQTLPNNIDISSSANGIVPLPNNVSSAWANNGMVKYTKIVTPNGGAIHFVAQDQLSDAQIVRARNILKFYLTIFSSEYGSSKTAIANKMADNQAVLLLLNGADGQGNEPNLPGQYLFEDEIAVEGHSWYMNNDWEHRDAAFEEILHLMHDTGIGVDGPNSFPGALPEYQAEIRAAQLNAHTNNFAIWPIGAGSDQDIQGWYNELDNENSLSQEYLASLIDSYYGLWGAWTETPGGMWGIYIAKTREEITSLDPMGAALVPKFFAPFINVDMNIDPSFSGTFVMNFNNNLAYTHKSQYLQHCTLTGSNSSHLQGNDLYNRLIGNDGSNELEGKKGNDKLDGQDGIDVAIFTGNHDEYNFEYYPNSTIVNDNIAERDGSDTLYNIEFIRFSDQDIDLSTSVENINFESNFKIYPNPAKDLIHLEIKLKEFDITSSKVKLIDATGKVVHIYDIKKDIIITSLDISKLPNGIYTLQIINEKISSSTKISIIK